MTEKCHYGEIIIHPEIHRLPLCLSRHPQNKTDEQIAALKTLEYIKKKKMINKTRLQVHIWLR